MTENEFRKMIKNGSKTIRQLNCSRSDDPRMSNKSKQLAGETMESTRRDVPLQESYQLSHIEAMFFGAHGRQLDEDNKAYIVKKLQDALVNLGFAHTDKQITSKITQRMDENQTDF